MKNSNKIKKPFYKRWWFIFFVSFSVVGYLMGFYEDDDQAPDQKQEVSADKKEEQKNETTSSAKKLSKKEKEKKEREDKAKKDKIKAEEKEKQRAIDSDITNLADEATVEQIGVLDELARQRFKQVYPYKGSRMHILGTLQSWTARDGKWFYKTTATVVNEYDAKMDVDVEVHIEPSSPDSGMVEIIGY